MATRVNIVDFECKKRLRMREDGGNETRWRIVFMFRNEGAKSSGWLMSSDKIAYPSCIVHGVSCLHQEPLKLRIHAMAVSKRMHQRRQSAGTVITDVREK